MSTNNQPHQNRRYSGGDRRPMSALYALVPLRFSAALYTAMGPVLFALTLFSFLAYWRFLESITPSASITSSASAMAADMDHLSAVGLDDDDFRIPFINERILSQVETLYVIPGGGSNIGSNNVGIGSLDKAGYPEWTQRRTEAAFQHYKRYYSGAEETSTFAAVRGSNADSQKHVVQVQRKHRNDKPKAIFLALSAGSLNAPNAQYADGRIIFECMHTIRHLKELGVPSELVFGDTFSWDTVTNALVLRQVVEAILLYRRRSSNNNSLGRRHSKSGWSWWPWATEALNEPSAPAIEQKSTLRRKGGELPLPDSTILRPLNEERSVPPNTLMIEVFISDFHADRVQATFEWVLGLRPSLHGFQLVINAVDSGHFVSSGSTHSSGAGSDSGSGGAEMPIDFTNRMEHEAEGIKRIKHNAQLVRTMPQLYAFLSLGGHQGLWKYQHEEYVKSKGPGW